MGLQILKFLVAIFIFSRLAHQKAAPENRCGTTETGYVCMDCFRMGKCINGEIGTVTRCPNSTSGQTYCDDSITTTTFYGVCTPPTSATNCSCQSINQCIADPNDPTVVLHCEAKPPVSDPPCTSPSAIDLTNCGCASCSADCPLLDDPNDDCASYFVCDGTDLTPPQSCIDGCFNQTLCGCAERGTTTTSATPTPSSNCPFIDDPNDDCSKVFYIDVTTGILYSLECSNGDCFNQELCECVSPDATTTTTTVAPSPNCDLFFDDPNDDCSSYYYFNGNTLIPLKCADPYCFDDVSCTCTANGGSGTTSSVITITPTTTTSTTTTSGTCPTGCPFIDDPNSCGGFYICDNGVMIPSDCPGILCFDQASCGCV